MTESRRVATPEQAELLLSVALRPLLELLMRGEQSASGVARTLGVSVQRAHYLLGRLTRAGVAEVTRVQPRAGRAVRLYQMPGRWFVPFAATGAETLETFLAGQILPRMERFAGLSVRQMGEMYGEWGYWLEADTLSMGDPEHTGRRITEGSEPFLLNIGTMHLPPEQVSAFKERLLALLREFEAHEDARHPAYTVGLLLAEGEVG